MNNYEYKTIDKDILKSIISKSIFYVRKLSSNTVNDEINPYKQIRIAHRDKMTKMYIIVLSDALPPIICKSKKECVTDEQLNSIHIKLFRKTEDGYTQFSINYKYIPIGVFDDSPTFLNGLSNDERAFMEHFIGMLSKLLKNQNSAINVKESKFFTTVKYPVKRNILNKKNNRKTVRWNNKVNVRLFNKNKNNNEMAAKMTASNVFPSEVMNMNEMTAATTTAATAATAATTTANIPSIKMKKYNNLWNNSNIENNISLPLQVQQNIPNILKTPFKRRKTIRNSSNKGIIPSHILNNI
jgi:hypothetical protein